MIRKASFRTSYRSSSCAIVNAASMTFSCWHHYRDGYMAKIFFCGDPHGRFNHIIRAVEAYRPEAIVLLGDQTAKHPLDIELAPILEKTKIYWIPGNHDSDNELVYDNLFGSALNRSGQLLHDGRGGLFLLHRSAQAGIGQYQLIT